MESHCGVESKILDLMKNFEVFPKVIPEGNNNGCEYIIESLTGPNLEKILVYRKNGFDIITVA